MRLCNRISSALTRITSFRIVSSDKTICGFSLQFIFVLVTVLLLFTFTLSVSVTTASLVSIELLTASLLLAFALLARATSRRRFNKTVRVPKRTAVSKAIRAVSSSSSSLSSLSTLFSAVMTDGMLLLLLPFSASEKEKRRGGERSHFVRKDDEVELEEYRLLARSLSRKTRSRSIEAIIEERAFERTPPTSSTTFVIPASRRLKRSIKIFVRNCQTLNRGYLPRKKIQD